MTPLPTALQLAPSKQQRTNRACASGLQLQNRSQSRDEQQSGRSTTTSSTSTSTAKKLSRGWGIAKTAQSTSVRSRATGVGEGGQRACQVSTRKPVRSVGHGLHVHIVGNGRLPQVGLQDRKPAVVIRKRYVDQLVKVTWRERDRAMQTKESKSRA